MQKSNIWEELGEDVELKNRSLLIVPETIPAYCYYIKSGKVFAYIENSNGLKDAYCVFNEGDLFLEQDLLRGKETALYYETLGKVQARKISKLQLETALLKQPELYHDILQSAMQFGDFLIEQMLNKQSGNAASKLSNLLLNFAKTHGVEADDSVIIHMKASQEFMAQISGLHRITVVREMKKMKEQNLVMRQGSWYVIPNITKLTQYRDMQSGKVS